MKNIQVITILFFLLSGVYQVNAQDAAGNTKDNKRNYTIFLKSTLQLDSVKAGQVAGIQQAYKDGIAKLMADGSLGDEGKRVKIKELMEVKNKQLKLLLTPSQQRKLIPTTELNSSSPAKPKQ